MSWWSISSLFSLPRAEHPLFLTVLTTVVFPIGRSLYQSWTWTHYCRHAVPNPYTKHTQAKASAYTPRFFPGFTDCCLCQLECLCMSHRINWNIKRPLSLLLLHSKAEPNRCTADCVCYILLFVYYTTINMPQLENICLWTVLSLLLLCVPVLQQHKNIIFKYYKPNNSDISYEPVQI